VLDQLDPLDQHVFFLLGRHGDRILVRIPVGANFVPGVDDHLDLLREGFERVPGNEPARPQATAGQQLQQPWNAHFPGKQAALDVARGILPAIRAEPAGNGVDVNPRWNT
jgi:hypothetical protein